MTRRDRDKLNGLLLKLTAWFSDPSKYSYPAGIGRGEARAIVALIRKSAPPTDRAYEEERT